MKVEEIDALLGGEAQRLADQYRTVPLDFMDGYGWALTQICRLFHDVEPQKWIPVSEKLPDEFDEYMCTCIDKYTARIYTSAVEYCPARKNPWVTGATVIAWMEHPKPYEVEK